MNNIFKNINVIIKLFALFLNFDGASVVAVRGEDKLIKT